MDDNYAVESILLVVLRLLLGCSHRCSNGNVCGDDHMCCFTCLQVLGDGITRYMRRLMHKVKSRCPTKMKKVRKVKNTIFKILKKVRKAKNMIFKILKKNGK